VSWLGHVRVRLIGALVVVRGLTGRLRAGLSYAAALRLGFGGSAEAASSQNIVDLSG